MSDLAAPAGKRRRKGNVHRAPYRARLEELLREEKYTLDELVAIIRAEFPGETVSRSSVHRYDKQIHAFTEKMHELETHAKVLAETYGKGAGDDASTLLANAMVTLATETAIKLNASGEAELDEIRTVSQIAKNALQGKRVSLDVRKQIELEVRERVLAEQKAKIEALGKTGAIDPAALKTVIQAAYAL